MSETKQEDQYMSVPQFCNAKWLAGKLCYIQICLAVAIVTCSFGKCFASKDELQYRDHEITAYVKSGYVQASLLQQSYVQLVAPDVQLQLQKLADEIAVSNGVDLEFRVHITNDGYIGTFSFGSGDIFIPIGYLDMVANRDEIAFGLAREIAVQHRLLHLQDMEKVYTEQKRNQMIYFVSGLVVSSAVNSVFRHYVVFPIHKKILEEVVSAPNISPYMSVEMQRLIIFQKNLEYKQMSKNIAPILGVLLGWAPRLITNETLMLISHMVKVADEDADTSRRKRKNQLGLTYMSAAGFDPDAGTAVINKIEEWWSKIESDK